MLIHAGSLPMSLTSLEIAVQWRGRGLNFRRLRPREHAAHLVGARGESRILRAQPLVIGWRIEARSSKALASSAGHPAWTSFAIFCEISLSVSQSATELCTSSSVALILPEVATRMLRALWTVTERTLR